VFVAAAAAAEWKERRKAKVVASTPAGYKKKEIEEKGDLAYAKISFCKVRLEKRNDL
jgi:hypothetical protein